MTISFVYVIFFLLGEKKNEVKMKKISAMVFTTVSLLLASCSSNIESPSLDFNETKSTKFTAQELNTATESLESLAPVFAKVVLNSDATLRELKKQALVREDGDYDVRYENIKSFDVSGNSNGRITSKNTLENALKYEFKKNNRSATVGTFESIINSIPYLNVYYYSPDYEKEFTDDEIFVTFLDYTIDEDEQTVLTAYDKNGNVHSISGIVPPDFPVIVLGISERINLENYNKLLNENFARTERAAYDSTITHNEILMGIDFYSEYGRWDPWPRGYPEVYILYAFADSGAKHYYPSVDKPGYYDFSERGFIFSMKNKPANENWIVKMYDEDIGPIITLPINLSYENKGFKVDVPIEFEIHNGDDLMGENSIDFFHKQNYKSAFGEAATLTFSYEER